MTPQLSRLSTSSSVAPVSMVNKFEVLSIEDYAHQDFLDWRQVRVLLFSTGGFVTCSASVFMARVHVRLLY